MLLVLDGCSGCKYSEVGTRLFAQIFLRKEECDNLKKFEDNVKDSFNDIISMMEKSYSKREDFENNFIMDNLLFTIIACFETKDAFIVKLFGDGYLIAQNKRGCLSYMKFSYGKYPPYYAYKYCQNIVSQYIDLSAYNDYGFKTFHFDKEEFSNIAIASDGIMPFAKGEISGIDEAIIQKNGIKINSLIRENKMIFSDDVTIAMFGGMDNGFYGII
jgi:hypothetical protein